MIRKQALAALVTLGIGAQASSVGAQGVLYGSDTLFVQTQQALVAAGIPDNVLHYAGTGSTQGGKAMNGGDSSAVPPIGAQSQQISPQSRFLADNECGAAINAGPGTGLMVGLDAIGVYMSKNSGTSGCNVLRNSGGTGVSFTDWRDVLRLLYSGQSTHTTAVDCSPNPAPRAPATAGTIVGRCDSAARKALISNWNNLFSDGGCNKGTCGTALRHAFRRDDSSGTTDVFLETLGLPKIPTGTASPLYTNQNRVFCNGNESEDLDPVRTLCDDKEDVCQAIEYSERKADPEGSAAPTGTASDPATFGGDLGVVLAVTMPTTVSQQFGADCAFGSFNYVNMLFTGNTEAQRCPDGNARAFSLCLWPLDAAGKYNCAAKKTTRPGVRTWANMDGRAYNLQPRDPSTGNVLIKPATGTFDVRFVSPGAYRIHQSQVMANAAAGTPTCRNPDATLQLGCLVMADPCSMAYGGRQALDWQKTGTTPVKALQVSLNANPPLGADNIPAIQAVAADPAADCNTYKTRYALARTLWMNSSKGFGDFTNFGNISDGPLASGVSKEQTYMKWISGHKSNWDTILQNNDFIPVPNNFRTKTCATTSSAN